MSCDHSDRYECECICHKRSGIIHDHACCEKCYECGFMIRCECWHCLGRSFYTTVFLGNECSTKIVELLHRRLDKGIEALGGEQQNGGMGSEYDERSSREAKLIIDYVIEDIICALGAKERFKRQL